MSLDPIAFPLAIVCVAALLAWWSYQSRRRAEARVAAASQVHLAIVQKFESAEQLTRLLESEDGLRLIDALSGTGTPRLLHGVLWCIGIGVSLIGLGGGLALLGLGRSIDTLPYLGLLIAAVGGALLLAGIVIRKLALRWGVLQPPRSSGC